MKKKRNRTQNNKTDESVQNEYTNENKKEEKKIRKHLHDNNNNYEFEENYSVIMSVRFSRISRGPHAWCGGECECVCVLCVQIWWCRYLILVQQQKLQLCRLTAAITATQRDETCTACRERHTLNAMQQRKKVSLTFLHCRFLQLSQMSLD